MKQILLGHLLALCLATVALAAGEGTAVGVNPDATAQRDATERILHVGADISVGELIVTGNNGQVQIVFADDTRLVLGPRSALLIETYLMASSTTAQRLAINALGGSFRFISGNSPKSAYSITTPTAAIAVRGTQFDFVAQRSTTTVMLYDGALEICNAAGDCAQVTQRCEVGTVTGRHADLHRRHSAQRAPLSLMFRFASFQTPLLAPFRINGATQCVEQPPAQTNAPSSDEQPTTQDQTRPQKPIN